MSATTNHDLCPFVWVCTCTLVPYFSCRLFTWAVSACSYQRFASQCIMKSNLLVLHLIHFEIALPDSCPYPNPTANARTSQRNHIPKSQTVSLYQITQCNLSWFRSSFTMFHQVIFNSVQVKFSWCGMLLSTALRVVEIIMFHQIILKSSSYVSSCCSWYSSFHHIKTCSCSYIFMLNSVPRHRQPRIANTS